MKHYALCLYYPNEDITKSCDKIIYTCTKCLYVFTNLYNF